MGRAEKRSSGGCWGWPLLLVVAAFVVTGIALLIPAKKNRNEAEPVPGPPGAIDVRHADALKIALQFFDVQKSGKLVDNKIPWRGDSAFKDGSEANLDLSKGMYDAGDHMKFGFPLAFTATVL